MIETTAVPKGLNLKKYIILFSVFLAQGCDLFFGDNTPEVNDFGLYDHPVSLYGKDFDKYLGLDRKVNTDPEKIYGVWDGGLAGKDSDGFSRYVYFKIEPEVFKSILVCVREEPYLVGYVETVSELSFDEGKLVIGEADTKNGLFFDKDGKEYSCNISPVPNQKFDFEIRENMLYFLDRLTNYEFAMTRYY